MTVKGCKVRSSYLDVARLVALGLAFALMCISGLFGQSRVFIIVELPIH